MLSEFFPAPVDRWDARVSRGSLDAADQTGPDEPRHSLGDPLGLPARKSELADHATFQCVFRQDRASFGIEISEDLECPQHPVGIAQAGRDRAPGAARCGFPDDDLRIVTVRDDTTVDCGRRSPDHERTLKLVRSPEERSTFWYPGHVENDSGEEITGPARRLKDQVRAVIAQFRPHHADPARLSPRPMIDPQRYAKACAPSSDLHSGGDRENAPAQMFAVKRLTPGGHPRGRAERRDSVLHVAGLRLRPGTRRSLFGWSAERFPVVLLRFNEPTGLHEGVGQRAEVGGRSVLRRLFRHASGDRLHCRMLGRLLECGLYPPVSGRVYAGVDVEEQMLLSLEDAQLRCGRIAQLARRDLPAHLPQRHAQRRCPAPPHPELSDEHARVHSARHPGAEVVGLPADCRGGCRPLLFLRPPPGVSCHMPPVCRNPSVATYSATSAAGRGMNCANVSGSGLFDAGHREGQPVLRPGDLFELGEL